MTPSLSEMSDLELMSALHRSIDAAPADKRAMYREMAFLLSSISQSVKQMSKDVRDTNVIAARIIDRCVRFEQDQARHAC